MSRRVSAFLLALTAGVVFGASRWYETGNVSELPARCLQKATAFVDEMKMHHREVGAPAERREFTYRSHYSFVKHKCFVHTDSTITLPLDKKVDYVSQVWDVDARDGAPPYARMSRSVWLIPNTDELIAYQDSPDRPRNMGGREWFAALMTQ